MDLKRIIIYLKSNMLDIRKRFAQENMDGLLLVLFTAIISGFSIFINSIGVKEFDSSIFTFAKNLVVAALLLAIIIGLGNFSDLRLLKRKHWLQLTLIGLIGGSIPFLLFFRGLQLAAGTTSAFLHKTIFIYITIFALLFLKEKLTKGLFIGAALLLLGNYLLIRPDFSFSLGHLLIVIAVIFWAAENTFAKYVLRQKELSGTLVAFGRMFFGSIFILAFLIFSGKIQLLGKLTATHFMWILLSTVFLLFYVFTYYNGLKHIKVTTAASILTIGSPITTLLSWLFAGKAITLSQSVGMLLIVAGIISVIWLTAIYTYIYSLLSRDSRAAKLLRD